MKSQIMSFFLEKLTQLGNTLRAVIPGTARDLPFPLAGSLIGALTLCLTANAQQAMPSDTQLLRTYNANREVSLVATVVKFESASAIPPIGAHVVLETASGQVDVHLGNAKVLEVNHLALNAGDSVRIVGEPMAFGEGTYFAARIVQKGTQAVAVRNAKGFPLTPAATLTPAQRVALRGVR